MDIAKDISFIPKKFIFQELLDNLDTPKRKTFLLIWIVRKFMEAKDEIFCKISAVLESVKSYLL